ncbi:DegT/DnrJ/EryC1/StrS family aminotransferase [Aliidiomarina celeris]|uniref:DegT/DnrJ/EryC1/StrS family aminotransferase n=1 Tax=Aliidiomarina celeris TaxID=2249428 RepID=UPI0018E5FA9E|nr:DegT/DnrJ/EryC1/StrS family aminotransferase [Aliidiomarina celeris]
MPHDENTDAALSERLQNYCDQLGFAPYRIAVSSTAAALQLACEAAGIGATDTVWMSPIGPVSHVNAARSCGAAVRFIDVDPATGALCSSTLAGMLSDAKRNNNLPRAVIAMHFAGASCDMATLRDLCRPHGILLIEDASHALGGHYNDQSVGSCAYADICVLGFYRAGNEHEPVAALLTTPHAEFSEHNVDVSRDTFTLMLAQLETLPACVERCNSLAENYLDAFGDTALMTLHVEFNVTPNYYLFVVQVDPDIRLAIYNALRAAGVPVQMHYEPVHLRPEYQQFGFAAGDYPGAEAYYEGTLSLPLHENMSDKAQQNVIARMLHALAELEAD